MRCVGLWRALGAYGKLTSKIEERWRARFGERAVGELREALEQLADSAADGQGGMRGSSLLAGIEPAANGWRAKEPAREAWPWFPIVLHRGGFPDGS